MTRITLLECLKDFTREVTAELLLPVRMQKDDTAPEQRPVQVYLMRLPDGASATKKAPYLLHQLVTAKDQQFVESGVASTAKVRSIFCVYHENEQEGGLLLLNLMERIRIALLKQVVIGRQFTLDLSAGVEVLLYPDDTAPYFLGEMVTTWELPPIEREVPEIWQN